MIATAEQKRNRYPFMGFVNNMSVSKKLFVLNILAIVSITILLTVSFVGLEAVSCFRAYVGGEGIYSKYQKDAVFQLFKYAYSYNEDHYKDFLRSNKIPLAARDARIELEKPNFNKKIAYQSLIKATIHPEDVQAIIFAFRLSQYINIGHINTVISMWSKADMHAMGLERLGYDLHKLISTGQINADKLQDILINIETLNNKLTVLENDFSSALGDGTRQIKSVLLNVTFLTFALFLLIDMAILFIIGKDIKGKVSLLKQGSERIAQGDYRVRVNIESKDELGELARTFNRMAGDVLNKNELLKLEINERKQAEEELQKAHDGLEQRVKERTSELVNVNTRLIQEVEERKQAEEAMQKSKTMLQSVFDGISEPLLLLDEKLVLKMFNKAASEYYQVEIKDNTQKLCYEELMGRSSPCPGCNIPSAILNSQHVSFERKGLMDSNRREQIFVYPVLGNDEKANSAIVRISDITEAKRMQMQLLQSEKLASLGFLISGIAHEIVNPNNFISFNVPIMRSYLQELIPIIDEYAKSHPDFELFGMGYPEFSKDIFKLLDNIEHGAKRINNTVSDLREFSRKKDRIGLDWIDIEQVIDKGVTLSRSKIRRMVKSLEINIPRDMPLIYTDPEILEQVLINLLINAAQAADKADSWIKLNVSLGTVWQDHLVIKVSDNGAGMDEETRQKIFDPFFTTKPSSEGTGMGLYLCHNLVELLGGRIEVESELSVGSTFNVILPDKDRRQIKRL
ncbi:MAG: ATP-binding protein [Thermodesulfobacteriota bacterium]|nr:ATP-binding protein [Thermodesulfobacteriota bacterium]